MKRFLEIVDTWAVPILLIATYAILIASSEMPPWIAGLTLVMLLGVLVLWLGMRALRLRAALSRLAAQGEPDELLALLARSQRKRWSAGGAAALATYAAIAHRLRGDPDAAHAALARVDVSRLRGAARRRWALRVSVERVALAAHAGRAAEARAIYDAEIAPGRLDRGRDVRALADEALAWVLVAEGNLAEAQPHATLLARDMRLGPAVSATGRWLLAACLAPTDPDAAAAARARPPRSRRTPGWARRRCRPPRSHRRRSAASASPRHRGCRGAAVTASRGP